MTVIRSDAGVGRELGVDRRWPPWSSATSSTSRSLAWSTIVDGRLRDLEGDRRPRPRSVVASASVSIEQVVASRQDGAVEAGESVMGCSSGAASVGAAGSHSGVADRDSGMRRVRDR